MATNEKITLNVDLYDNIMTEQKGDYTGRARITGSLHNKEIAARIIKASTGRKPSRTSSTLPTRRRWKPSPKGRAW